MSRPSVIRVAILLPTLLVGGAERLVLEELACLQRDDRFVFEVHLVFEKGPFYEQVRKLGIPIHVWNAPHKSPKMLLSYLNIVRHLRVTGCHILHSHLLDSIGPLVGKLAGARVVSTVHSDKPYSSIEKYVLSTSDLALGCGRQVVENIRKFIPHRKVALLNNAIQQPHHRQEHREKILKRYGLGDNCTLIVSLGRCTRAKGFDVLIEAFSIIAKEIPEAMLLIGGDGEERPGLEQQVRASGLSDRIRLPGIINDIHEVLDVCDVYVNASRFEGLPMTLLEAMAHGKPIVATDVGGNSELIQEGITGLLVRPDSSLALAQSVITLLQNNEVRERVSTAAFNLFVREYTIEQHCEALKIFYFQMVQGSNA